MAYDESKIMRRAYVPDVEIVGFLIGVHLDKVPTPAAHEECEAVRQ